MPEARGKTAVRAQQRQGVSAEFSRRDRVGFSANAARTGQAAPRAVSGNAPGSVSASAPASAPSSAPGGQPRPNPLSTARAPASIQACSEATNQAENPWLSNALAASAWGTNVA